MPASALDAIFKAYDVRGIVPDQLDAGLARRFGAAFADFAAGAPIVLGRDTRPSGVALVAAFAEGAVAQGAAVIDIGVVSTDLVYFASGKLDAAGAMFTASHNPAQYNGVKMCLPGAKPVGQDTGLAEIKASIESGGPPPAATPGTLTQRDMLDDFAEHVVSFIDRSSLRPLKVVADTANGAGGVVVPAVFAKLPFEIEVLFAELDGTFPNHPADPIQPENLRDLQARVREVGADVGLAFDGDADRVFLLDERGEPVSGSLTTAMVAKRMLERNPGATILHNLICSKTVPEVIRENGGTPVRTRVGHSFIKTVMDDTGAVFGGEHSGHYYFRDNYRADSGLIAAMVVLEELCCSRRPLSELRVPFERYAASGEINSPVGDTEAAMARVRAAFPDAAVDDLDGLTFDLGDWWFNVRASNTEPLLRLNLEAKDAAACEARVAEVLDLLRKDT